MDGIQLTPQPPMLKADWHLILFQGENGFTKDVQEVEDAAACLQMTASEVGCQGGNLDRGVLETVVGSSHDDE